MGVHTHARTRAFFCLTLPPRHSYSQFGNNYWLLTDDTNYTQLLPYDQEDNYTPAWANWTTDRYFLNCSALPGHHCVPHPLTQRLYTHTAQRALFAAMLERVVRGLFAAPALPQRVQALTAFVAPFLQRDRWYGADVKGYSGAFDDYGRVFVPALLQYIAQRGRSALA